MGCMGSRVDVEADGRQYHLKRLIASGGFSQIYSAEDLESGERVAIKKITCHSAAEIDRTYREIEIHRRFGCHFNRDGGSQEDEEVCHLLTSMSSATRNGEKIEDVGVKFEKNGDSCVTLGNFFAHKPLDATTSRYLMPIFGVGEERVSRIPSAQPIISFSLVFPLCKLGSLQDELAARRATKNYISHKRIVYLFRQVCCALEVLHAAKPPIAHRDLKPANLLLRTEDHLLLTDFGSAMECPIIIEDARQRRAVLDAAAEFCTMPYRAPELFTCETGLRLDESVDIWSLGCVLYAMCYFCSPYDEVHERGDSVALAVQSARLKFDADAPIEESITSLISSLVKFSPGERPRISEILERIGSL